MARDAQRFNSILNNLLAPATGKVYNNQPIRVSSREGIRRASQRAAGTANPLDSSDSRMGAYENVLGALEDEKNRLLDSIQRRQRAVNLTLDSEIPPIQATGSGIESQENLENLLRDSENKFGRSIKNFGGELLSRVGDLASRPLYAVNEAMKEQLEEIDKGSNPFGTFDDYLRGAWEGFSGQDKTTPGEFLEYATDPDVERNRTGLGQAFALSNIYSPVSEPNRRLREEDGANNAVSRWVNRITAFAGETIGDPANLIGGKVVASSRIGNRLDDVYRKTVNKAVKDTSFESMARAGGSVDGRLTAKTTASDSIIKRMADVADETILDPQTGRMVAVNNQLTKTHLVTEGVNEAREFALRSFEKNYEKLLDGSLSTSSQTYRNLVKNKPIWKTFDETLRASVKDAAPTGGSYRAAFENAAEVARNTLTPDLEKLARGMEQSLDGQMFNTVAIRLGNKQIPIKVLGQAYDVVKRKTPVGAPRAFSFNNSFPGRTGQSIALGRRWGHVNYEDFKSRVKPISQQLDAGQRQIVSQHLDMGTLPEDPLLRDATEFVRDEYAQILKEEVEAGVRNLSDSRVATNYQYVYVRPTVRNTKKARAAFKNARRNEVSTNQFLKTTAKDAKEMGLRVSDDPFENLAHRRLKSERLKSRSQVSEGFFRYYGISSKNITKDQADKMGLVKIADPSKPTGGRYKLNQKLQNYVDETGEALYLPEDVAEVYDRFIKLADVNLGGEELNQYMRIYDKVLNFFKVSATVPFPGFHVKNMVGDIFLGFMDGVNPAVYGRYINAKRSKNGTLKFRNGMEMHVDSLDNIYQRWAGGGGFVETEIFPTTKIGVRGLSPRRPANAVREMSEAREDFGRVVHFYHALDEETAKLGVRDLTTERGQKALSNATWRVDKYKFDYGALTATEKQVMRRAIPFYTFLRKSTPLMLEGLLMNPSLFGKAYRFFDGDLGGRAAQWQRELGFANFGDPEEPYVMPQNILPTDSLLTWGQDPLNLGVMADNALNSMPPAIKAPIELATGRSTFTGQELFEGEQPSISEQASYLGETFFPPLSTGKKLAEQISEGEYDPTEFVFGNRLALGLSVDKLRLEEQERNLNSFLGYYKRELTELSKKTEPYGIKVFVSDAKSGISIKVRETVGSRRDLYKGDLQGAMNFIDQYMARNPEISDDAEIVEYVEDQQIRTGARGSVRPELRILDD